MMAASNGPCPISNDTICPSEKPWCKKTSTGRHEIGPRRWGGERTVEGRVRDPSGLHTITSGLTIWFLASNALMQESAVSALRHPLEPEGHTALQGATFGGTGIPFRQVVAIHPLARGQGRILTSSSLALLGPFAHGDLEGCIGEGEDARGLRDLLHGSPQGGLNPDGVRHGRLDFDPVPWPSSAFQTSPA